MNPNVLVICQTFKPTACTLHKFLLVDLSWFDYRCWDSQEEKDLVFKGKNNRRSQRYQAVLNRLLCQDDPYVEVFVEQPKENSTTYLVDDAKRLQARIFRQVMAERARLEQAVGEVPVNNNKKGGRL